MMLNVTEKDLSEEEKKYLQELHKTVYEKAKYETDRFCVICGKEVSSYCNSHSVPKFCLLNISFGQRLDCLNSIIRQPIGKLELGAKEAGVFFSICRECDTREFKTYETPELYEKKEVSQTMMYQIAMKCYVREIYRHRLQQKYYSYFNSECIVPIKIGFDELAKAEMDDLMAFSNEYIQLRKGKIKFEMLYYEKLPYKVPIAFQDCINVVSDFNGDLINNPYLDSKKQQMLFVCVFPLKKESVVIIFTDKNKRHYSTFIKQFKKLNLENKLKSILFMMFAYSENFFISKNIKADLINDKKIMEIAKFLTLNVNAPRSIAIKEALLQFKLSNAFELENYLDEKYSLC